MRKKSRLFFAVFSKLSLVATLLVVFVFAYFSFMFISPSSSLHEKFFGKKAEFQGIITLWNIDTFEGGSGSREAFLQSQAMNFEKKNKGAFFKIENLSIDEMNARLENNQLPNMITFGTGVGGVFRDRLIELDGVEEKIMPNFLASGLYNGRLLACPFAFGGYALLSSSARIENAKKEVGSLRDLAFELAFEKKLKKSTKNVYSLTFGKNNFVDGFKVLSREFDFSISDMKEKYIVDPLYNMQTPYDAYVSYISGNSSILLGTQRDIFRLENRKNAGKEDDILLCPLSKFTDLVCYAAVLNGEKKMVSTCKSFVEFLVSDESQQKLSQIGLLSPTNQKLYDEGLLCEFENAFGETTCVECVF